MSQVLETVGYVAILLLSTVGFVVVMWLAWVGLGRVLHLVELQNPKVPIETEKEIHADRELNTTGH